MTDAFRLADIPTGPFDTEPDVPYLGPNIARELMTEALAAGGVDLGTYDRKIVAWLAGLDGSVIVPVLSWLRSVERKQDDEAATPIAYVRPAAPDMQLNRAERERAHMYPWDVWCRPCGVRLYSTATEEAAQDAADKHSADHDPAYLNDTRQCPEIHHGLTRPHTTAECPKVEEDQ